EPGFVSLRKASGQLVDGSVKEAFGGIRRHLCLQLRHHFQHQRLGQHYARPHAAPEVIDGRVGPHRKLARPRQPIVVVLHCFEGLRAGARAQLHQAIGQRIELREGYHPRIQLQA
nr:hypothetical protein [Tanacetum cinerariifolium]